MGFFNNLTLGTRSFFVNDNTGRAGVSRSWYIADLDHMSFGLRSLVVQYLPTISSRA